MRTQQAAPAADRFSFVLENLEQTRVQLEQELADVEAVIHAVRQRSAPKVRLRDITRPKPAAKNGSESRSAPSTAKNGHEGKRTRLSGEALETVKSQAKKRWETTNDSAATIAKALGTAESAVYRWSRDGKWKRPNPGAVTSPAAAAPKPVPAGEQLAGSVKCTNPDCGVMTDYDPCRRCGQKLKRRNW